MAVSVLEIFKVGIGPSSSHTVGPMRAARMFTLALAEQGVMTSVTRVLSEMFGSLGATRLGRLIIGVQQVLAETEPQSIVSQLQAEMSDFLEVRSLLVDLLAFIERKAPEEQVRSGAEVLGARLKNLRFGA